MVRIIRVLQLSNGSLTNDIAPNLDRFCIVRLLNNSSVNFVIRPQFSFRIAIQNV